MKRFVDLRDAEVGGKFAWWDTVTDTFETHGGNMAWDDWIDFASSYKGAELDRYRRLVPAWVHENRAPSPPIIA